MLAAGTESCKVRHANQGLASQRLLRNGQSDLGPLCGLHPACGHLLQGLPHVHLQNTSLAWTVKSVSRICHPLTEGKRTWQDPVPEEYFSFCTAGAEFQPLGPETTMSTWYPWAAGFGCFPFACNGLSGKSLLRWAVRLYSRSGAACAWQLRLHVSASATMLSHRCSHPCMSLQWKSCCTDERGPQRHFLW